MTLHYTVGADAEGHLLAVRVAHRRRCGRLCGHQRKVPAARGVPLLRPLSRAERGCRSQGRIHQQSHQRRHARLRHQPGALRHGRHHGHAGGTSGRGRLRHSRAQHAESRATPSPPARSCAKACGIAAQRSKPSRTFTRARNIAGIGCGIKSTGIGNGTIESGHAAIRVLEGGRLEVLTGYTEMGQGLFTTIRQAVCEETGLSPEIMTSAGTRSWAPSAARRGPRAPLR